MTDSREETAGLHSTPQRTVEAEEEYLVVVVTL